MAQMPSPPPYIPPDDAALRMSELIPFRSARISIWRSKSFVPLVIVTIACVALFGFGGSVKTYGDIKTYMDVVATVMLVLAFLVLYIYSGEQKNVLWYAVPAAITVAQLLFLIEPYIYVFRKVLPGNTETTGFVPTFIGMFFGAGLMEEVLKGVPILLALGLALWLRRTGSPGNVVTRNLALQGPLDGLLMGAAAGAAFILVETMLMYVPRTIGGFKETSLGFLMGFVLMIPRVMKTIAGHMGYAGIFGYFVGLAVTHPRAAWKLVPFGLLVASVLHAFWNSADELSKDYGAYPAAALIGLTFFACLLKARQLEASRIGGYIDGRSILALTPDSSPPPVVPGGIVPPAPSGIAGALAGTATALEKAVGVTARTTAPVPAAVTALAVPDHGLSIGSGATRYALASGLPIDFSALFGAAGVPPGYQGTIVGGPGGAFAIINTGTGTWTAVGPDGSATTVAPRAGCGVTAGTRLDFGTAPLDIQAY